MSVSLEQILGYVTIGKAIQQTVSGIPKPLPDAFYTSHSRTLGNKGVYMRTTGERRTAPKSAYGSPARRLDLKSVAEVPVKLVHLFNEQSFNPLLFSQLRSKESYDQDTALDEVKRQVNEFAVRHENTRIAAVTQVLKNGILYWDSNGNLLPSSSGSSESHSFQMNANNQNQLNGIITASWALVSTDIPLQLRNLKKRARRLTGYPIKYAIYGENIPTYMTQNDYVLDYLARNPTKNTDFLGSAELGDLFGLTWIPAYEAFYEDDDGTNQDLWSGDTVVFCPEVSEEWWDVIEGSYQVPTTVNISSSADAAMRSTSTVYGRFGFGFYHLDSMQILGRHGDTFLPILKNPDVVFQADVTP